LGVGRRSRDRDERVVLHARETKLPCVGNPLLASWPAVREVVADELPVPNRGRVHALARPSQERIYGLGAHSIGVGGEFTDYDRRKQLHGVRADNAVGELMVQQAVPNYVRVEDVTSAHSGRPEKC
jgi:hypothetical protein